LNKILKQIIEIKSNKLLIFIETISIVSLLLAIYYVAFRILPKIVEITQTISLILALFITIIIIFICFRLVFDKKKASFLYLLKKFRFQKINKKTIYQAIWIFLIAAILSGLMRLILDYLNITFISNEQFEIAKFHKQSAGPFFMPLSILVVVIFGPLQEEVLFRGYLLPKQEAAIGKHAWVLNGFAFNFTHLLVYDFVSLLLISPFCFLLAYKVQKHKNTSIGLLAHLFVNLGFIVRLLMV
jgi:membrane protease YdiL (CAAX protease family)